MMQYIKRFSLLLIIIILIILLAITAYISIQDINASKAKDYLIEKYDFDKLEIFSYKTIEYVYEEDTDCSSLWFKKCTSQENLYKDIDFITTDGKKIHVTQYNDGTFVDNYKKDN